MSINPNPSSNPPTPPAGPAGAPKPPGQGGATGAGQQNQGTGPVGSGEHIVQQGECILSIACDHGHLVDTIFNDPANTQLKTVRKEPNILLPGDRVHIPTKQRKQSPCQTAQRHTFRKKGSAVLRLRIVEEPEQKNPPPPPPAPPVNKGPRGRDSITQDPPAQVHKIEDVPRANVPFKLDLGRIHLTSATDADGRINVSIPPNAKQGKLTLDPGTASEVTLPILLGFLNPLTEISGIKQRLTNLGFACDDGTERFSPALHAALRAFQQKHGMQETGDIDQPTRDKLRQLHES